MTSITQENPIGGSRLKLIKPTLLEIKAPTTKSPEMAHSRCFAVRFMPRRTAKSPLCLAFLASAHGKDAPFAVRFFKVHGKETISAVRFFPGAQQRASHGVSSGRRQLLFFTVHREKTHDKDYLPCVVRRGARQRGFTVQNATVCPLPCAPTKNARQRVCHAF
jgi:hypothetical protein